MIPAVLGISLLAHLTIILAAKTKKFLNTRGIVRKTEHRAPSRAFMSLVIAIITEFVIVLVIASSLTILGAGAFSDKSNFKIIKSALNEFEIKSLTRDAAILLTD